MTLVRSLTVLACALVSVLIGAHADLRHPDRGEIRADIPIRVTIAGVEPDRRRVRLKAGQAARILIDQGETDLALTLIAPGNKRSASDTRERSIESATILAETDGVFEIEFRALDPTERRDTYVVRLEPSRPLTARARRQRAAEEVTSDGKRLAAEASDEARQAALPQLRAGVTLWRELEDQAMVASTLAMIGDFRHGMAEYGEAEEAYLESLALSRALGDARLEAEVLNNLGLGHWRRGRLTDASGYFEQALATWRALPLPYGEAATLTNEGLLFYEAGAYQQALDRHVRALEIFEAVKDVRGEAYAINNIAVTYHALGDFDAAVAHLTRAIPRFHDAGDVIAEGRARIRLGRIHLARGDVRAAEGIAAETRPVVDGARNRLMEADAFVLLGQIAAATGAREQALSHYEQAVAAYPSVGSRRGVATALHYRGVALFSVGQHAKALASLEQSRAIRHAMGLRDAEAETLFQLALVEWQTDDVAQAQAHLRDALTLIEDVRGRVAGEYSRITYFASRQRYFSTYIDLLMQLHARHPARGFAAEAFQTSERAHARSLIELIGESSAEIRRGVDPVLLARERELQQQLDFWSYRLAALMDRGENDQAPYVRQTLDELLARYRETEAQIRSASPGFAALITPPALTVEQVQRQLLDGDTTMLRFVLGEQRSHVWLVTPRGLTVKALPPRAQVDGLARRVYELVSTKRSRTNAADLFAQYQHEAAKLSAMILGPIAADLKARRLLIVSDGFLQLVPFGALPEPGGRAPLIARHEIVTLPSASLLAVLRREVGRRPVAPKTVFVVADPVYEATDPRVKREGATASPGRPDGNPIPEPIFAATRLPFSLVEARAILGLVPPPLRGEAMGFAANRETATSPALRDYRIVHFATHATSDANHPELSGIVLSLFGPDGAAQDGLLRLHEIYSRVSLRADLVVLSACETAVGKDMPGEGMMGLARAVFAAGGASVIASLYKVDDDRTAELMENFYRRLLGAPRFRPAAALRAAQLKMLAEPEWQDPHWWSGFVLIGDSERLETGTAG